jgi:hypothetical protein
MWGYRKVASRHLAGDAQTADLACERFWKAASFAPCCYRRLIQLAF